MDTGCWILDDGCWILDDGCWILDDGCWILDSGYRNERSIFDIYDLVPAYLKNYSFT
ncbi:MAG TPA: hypothetical protein VMT35_17345 [Ignavibacteriaceae bacterium]|nr:hypothetical protein [Ignavibacteriaceae bacterium]